MTEDTVPDTTIHEPSMTGSEVDMLLFALDRSRAQFAWKCGGLDTAGLHKAHPPSTMTLGAAQACRPRRVQVRPRNIGDARADGGDVAEPVWRAWETVDFEADPDWEWRTAADDSPEDLHGFWRGAVEWSRAAWAAALADGGLDQPSKFNTDDGESPNLRRLLVDLHDEHARHTGHADLLREAVDGLAGENPPQSA